MDKRENSDSRDSRLLFLSHSGADTKAAGAIVDRIERTPEARKRGLKVWFDKKDLEPGQSWQAQLEQALERDSTAFAVYVGSRGVINWVESEVRVALSRARSDPDYPFIPILSKQSSGSDALPAFARQYQGVIDIENNPKEFAKLIRAVTGQDRRAAVALADEPFLGLRAFEEKDTHLFFGRDEDSDELTQRLKRSRLLMVVGDSGSGKSSLVKAGLIPLYRGGAFVERRDPRSDAIVWHVVETRPRSNPFDSLAESIAAVARTIGRSQGDIRVLRHMVRDRKPQEVADALIDGAPKYAKILVVVDQFEELLTISDKIFRGPYIDTLLYLAKLDSPAEFRIVLTIRRDYYNLCHEYSEFYAWLEDRERGAKFSINSMSDKQLRSCIEKPLALTTVGDTDVFVDRVLADVGDQPGELALLEMALTESWRRRGQYSGDMLQAYTSIGGTAGALANVADEVFQKLDDFEQPLAEASFIRLVRLGETGGTTRRMASRDEFSTDAWRILQKLAKGDYGRLIHIGGVSQQEPDVTDLEHQHSGDIADSKEQLTTELHGQQTAETAELSHEALVSQWPRYQGWLQASPELKRVHDGLILATKRWTTLTSKKSEELLTGSRLADAIQVLDKHPSWLSPQEHAFIKASRTRSRKRSFLEKGAVALLVVLAMTAAWFGYNAIREKEKAQVAEIAAIEARKRGETEKLKAQKAEKIAEERRKIALAGQLSAQAELIRKQQPNLLERSILLAIESLMRIPSGVASQALSRALSLVRHPIASIMSGGQISYVGFSPNGKFLAASTKSSLKIPSMVFVWDVLAKKEIHKIKAKADVRSLAWSPCGEYLSVAAGATVDIWELKIAERIAILQHKSGVKVSIFSPKGGLVGTACADGTSWIWRVGNWKKEALIIKHQQSKESPKISAIAFSSDEKYLATAGTDGAVRLWDLNRLSEGPDTTFREHRGLKDMAMSPDDRYIATASWGRVVRLWDVETGKEVINFSHDDLITKIIFSPNGRYLASSSGDKTIRIVDISNLNLLPPMEHNDTVHVLSFSPDGKFIATGSSDLTARLWYVKNGQEVARIIHEGDISAINFSPDGKLLAMGSVDHSVSILNVENTPLYEVTIEHYAAPTSIAFSYDGKFLASACGRIVGSLDRRIDNIVKIWDLADNRQKARLKHKSAINSLAFSQDRNLLTTLSNNGTARIWEIESGVKIKEINSIKEISPNGKYAITKEEGPDYLSRIIEIASGREIDKTEIQFTEVVFSGSGEYAATIGSANTIKVLKMKDGTQLANWNPVDYLDKVKAISPNGKYVVGSVVTEGAYIVKIWDTTTLKDVTPLKNIRPGLLEFSLDNKYFSIQIKPGVVILWSTTDWKKVCELDHGTEVSDISFSQDSRYLATAGLGGVAKLWDLSTGREIWRQERGSPVDKSVFNPDGSLLAVASRDKTIWVGVWQPDNLVVQACLNLSRNMTQEEWLEYIGEEQYRKTCQKLQRQSFVKLLSPNKSAETSVAVEKALFSVSTFAESLGENESDRDLARSVKILLEDAKKLAKNGDFHRSRAKLHEFMELAIKFPKQTYIFDPEVDSENFAISLMLSTADEFIKDGKILKAIMAYREFEEKHKTLRIPSENWKKLCWDGALFGFAEKVLNACERGVLAAPMDQKAFFRDSRGLARALTGDFKGAIEDFRAIVTWLNKIGLHENMKRKRESWIVELEAGRNPFDEGTLEALGKKN